jgi:hypothetical protein
MPASFSSTLTHLRLTSFQVECTDIVNLDRVLRNMLLLEQLDLSRTALPVQLDVNGFCPPCDQPRLMASLGWLSLTGIPTAILYFFRMFGITANTSLSLHYFQPNSKHESVVILLSPLRRGATASLSRFAGRLPLL